VATLALQIRSNVALTMTSVRQSMGALRLLLLDEPTAALDPAAEHHLYEEYVAASLRTREIGGITLVVSHRFSSVRMADLIVVLENGVVTEKGVHEALMALGGTYSQMFRTQALAYGVRSDG